MTLRFFHKFIDILILFSFKFSIALYFLLLILGRLAQTQSLGLDKIGVEVDSASGKIITNNEQTSVPNIYAIGDVLLVSIAILDDNNNNNRFNAFSIKFFIIVKEVWW